MGNPSPSPSPRPSPSPCPSLSPNPNPSPNPSRYSCEQEAGDVFLVPDMWAHASLSHELSVSIAVHPEVGANEFSFSR